MIDMIGWPLVNLLCLLVGTLVTLLSITGRQPSNSRRQTQEHQHDQAT